MNKTFPAPEIQFLGNNTLLLHKKALMHSAQKETFYLTVRITKGATIIAPLRPTSFRGKFIV